MPTEDFESVIQTIRQRVRQSLLGDQHELARRIARRRKPALVDELKMSLESLAQHTNKVYKSERLKGQRALLLKYRKPIPQRLILKRDQILERLKSNQPIAEIASALKIKRTSVERHMRDLKRLNQLPRQRTKRQQVLNLYNQGFQRQEIADALDMTPHRVSTRLTDLRRAGELSEELRRYTRAKRGHFNISLIPGCKHPGL